MGKATNFNFCTHIPSIHRNKSPLQISGKVAGCVVRTLKTFQGTRILGASRGLLCDSYAVLFYNGCTNVGLRIVELEACSLASISRLLGALAEMSIASWFNT